MQAKMQNARMGALARLTALLDDGDSEDMRGKPEGDAGDKNPDEKSGRDGAVDPATFFAKGGEVGGGDHDETSGNDFGSAWEELTGKSFRRPQDSEGLGGESDDDGLGVDAAGEGEEMSDEDKAKLTAAYERHVLGKR